MAGPSKDCVPGIGVISENRPPKLPELILLDTKSTQVPDFAVAILARRMRLPRDPPI